MSANKEVKELLSRAHALGCEIEHSKRGGHYKVKTPNGGLVIVASSPSCHRAIKNLVSEFRRAGVSL